MDVESKQADNCHNHTGTASALEAEVLDSEEGGNAGAECYKDSAARQSGGLMQVSMDVWKERTLRESLRPKTGSELVQQSCTMDIAIAVAVDGLRQGRTDRVKVVVLERKGLEVLESCRPNTGEMLKLNS